MMNLETAAEKIASSITQTLQMDDEKKSVIAYGIFGFLQVLASILAVILFGFLFGVMGEALVVSFSIAILRKYSGGVHASTPGKCLIMGTVISVLPAIVIARVPQNILIVIFSGIAVFLWSFYEVFSKAPVDSAKKPIANINKRKRLRSGSLVILGGYLLISVCLVSFYYFAKGPESYLSYTVCILFGTAWQTLTLTRAGNHLLMLIDKDS